MREGCSVNPLQLTPSRLDAATARARLAAIVGVAPRNVRLFVVCVGLVGYGLWVVSLRPFTWPSLLVVEVSGLVALVLGAVRESRPPTAVDVSMRATWGWLGLVALLAAWELATYLQHPRDEHPTLSWLTDRLLDTEPTRALAFAIWLAGAYRLARPSRR